MKILNQLNQRERKTLLVCLVACAAMLLWFLVLEPGVKQGRQLRSQLQQQRQKLSILLAKEGTSEALKQKNLTQAVPMLEMPTASEKQNQLLRDKITQQLGQAGVQVKNFTFSSGIAQGPGATDVITLRCQGKCQFTSLARFLDDLRKNPYYVGIEELSIKTDEKNRQNLDIAFTVSTFRQSGA
jgi:glutamate/tyrosine decarboxylase-like PLP-dependent enzyme